MKHNEYKGCTIEWDEEFGLLADPERTSYTVYDAEGECLGTIDREFHLVGGSYNAHAARRGRTHSWGFSFFMAHPTKLIQVNFEASEFKTARTAFKAFVDEHLSTRAENAELFEVVE